MPAPVIEPEGHPGRPRSVWPWVLVIVLILALAGAAYVILTNWSTAEAEMRTVPSIVGLSEADAQAKLEAEGLKWEKEGVQPSADVAEGKIARQDPVQNFKLEKGKTVSYWVSSGEGKVEVPDVTNIDQAKAAATLAKLGLEYTTKPEVNADVEPGMVLRQNPEAGKKVDAGTTVTLIVAAASDTVKVPYLIGMMKDNATASLMSMDLVPVVQEVDSDQPGGTVVDQDPKSGSELKPGDKVTVYVSNAPVETTVKVPAVAALGLTEAQAKARLALYGLKAKVIDLETPDYKPGLCIYQNPAAGETVKIGSTVEITITREPVTTTTTTEPPTTTTTTAPTTTSSSVAP